VIDNDTLARLAKLEGIIDSYYYFDTSDEDMKNGLYAGMIEALDDPYAKYYTAEEFAKMMEDESGEYAGIGVTVRQDPDTGAIVAVGILEGAPAEDVDILPGDYVVQIDDYEIQKSDDLDYLVSLIRGEPGTDVKLKIYRMTDGKYHDVTITRQIVENKTVSYYMIDDKIGYVRVTQFISNTGELFRAAIEDLKSQGMEGMIIDVRDNPGGMLSTVVDMCDYLLPEGMIVYQKDKSGTVLSEYKSTNDEFYDGPMVVLTNGESASASEILTASLKEYGVATIVGENTFGKGIVQSVIPLEDGSAVKLTTAKYFTPNGNDIHGKGVAPDIEIKLPDDYTAEDFQGEKDTQYQKGIEVLKEKLGMSTESAGDSDIGEETTSEENEITEETSSSEE
ncbi:MAG: S41 family peptidase, partial [Coprococcus sp.]